MKQYLLVMALLSIIFFSCKKVDVTFNNEFSSDKYITGEYKGVFSWSKSNSELLRIAEEENHQGLFSIKYIDERRIEITSDISCDIKYKVYEMTLSKMKHTDDNTEYYFTGRAKGYAEKINSFAEMSLITSKEKSEFSFYGCNSFDGVTGESLRVTEATLKKK